MIFTNGIFTRELTCPLYNIKNLKHLARQSMETKQSMLGFFFICCKLNTTTSSVHFQQSNNFDNSFVANEALKIVYFLMLFIIFCIITIIFGE